VLRKDGVENATRNAAHAAVGIDAKTFRQNDGAFANETIIADFCDDGGFA